MRSDAAARGFISLAGITRDTRFPRAIHRAARASVCRDATGCAADCKTATLWRRHERPGGQEPAHAQDRALGTKSASGNSVVASSARGEPAPSFVLARRGARPSRSKSRAWWRWRRPRRRRNSGHLHTRRSQRAGRRRSAASPGVTSRPASCRRSRRDGHDRARSRSATGARGGTWFAPSDGRRDDGASHQSPPRPWPRLQGSCFFSWERRSAAPPRRPRGAAARPRGWLPERAAGLRPRRTEGTSQRASPPRRVASG